MGVQQRGVVPQRDASEGSLDEEIRDAVAVVVAVAAAVVVRVVPLPCDEEEEELHVGLRNALEQDLPVALAAAAAVADDDARDVPRRTPQSLRDSLLHDNRQKNDDIHCRARILLIDTAYLYEGSSLSLSYRLTSGCDTTAPSTHMQEHSKAIRKW